MAERFWLNKLHNICKFDLECKLAYLMYAVFSETELIWLLLWLLLRWSARESGASYACTLGVKISLQMKNSHVGSHTSEIS